MKFEQHKTVDYIVIDDNNDVAITMLDKMPPPLSSSLVSPMTISNSLHINGIASSSTLLFKPNPREITTTTNPNNTTNLTNTTMNTTAVTYPNNSITDKSFKWHVDGGGKVRYPQSTEKGKLKSNKITIQKQYFKCAVVGCKVRKSVFQISIG
jgi:hypothetical protein